MIFERNDDSGLLFHHAIQVQTQQHSIESQIYLSSDFLSPSPHTLSAFICSEQVWYTHIWLWSAIWISSSVFVVTFFCPFFIIFHSSQRQSILLPVKWPCIFFTCISYVYIFSFCSVCVCFCYGFQFIASSVSLVSSHSSLRPFVHSCIIWTWSEMLIRIYLHSRLHITVFNRSIIHFGCMILTMQFHMPGWLLLHAMLLGWIHWLFFLQRYFVCVSQWV